MNEPEKPKKGWGWLQWGVVILVLLFSILLTFDMVSPMSDQISKANQTSSSNNCRQIIMAMKIWAQEHNGAYPDSGIGDGASANGVFRKLVQEEIILDERIFGGKQSPFQPDGYIGQAPEFLEAVAAGENHWMMIAGQNIKSGGTRPLVFENALKPVWPLAWLPHHYLQRGRTWRNGKIIIGRNDGSVNVETLEKHSGELRLSDSTLKAFGMPSLTDIKVLDIEEKK